jgi:FixJ family two-component response regulator
LLITDVVMPTTNGPELAEQLTAIRPETKVLFISGYPDYAVQFPKALAEGAALLQKPFRLEALARKVREVLGS